LKATLSSVKDKHVEIDYTNYTLTFYGTKDLKYLPSKTALKFHKANDRVRLLKGHVGSGKTTMCCAELIFRAAGMPPCIDGVRRSRFAIIRNTYGDLVKTTLHTWMQWFNNEYYTLGSMVYRKSPSFYIKHTFNDGYGVIELELLPIALDNVQDVTKHLKSLEVTGVYINELSEIHPAVLDFFTGGRMPRYPRRLDFSEELQKKKKIHWSGTICDTNPPDQDHWIYKMFEVDKPKEYILFDQPPAVIKSRDGYIINPEAENIRNIDNGAEEYVKMTYGKSENFIRVYLMGEYGTVTGEQVVFENYNDNIHSIDEVEININEPIIMAADLGTVAPTILLAQMNEGRLVVFKEFCGSFMTITELCDNYVLPWITKNCEGMKIEICLYDPADTYDGAQQLRAFFGSVVQPAATNSINVRLEAVSSLLNKLCGGQPALVIERDSCMQLRKGFNGKYYYKRFRVIGTSAHEERYDDYPYKSHPYSDVQDCLQYIAMYVANKFAMGEETDHEFEKYQLEAHRNQASRITGY